MRARIYDPVGPPWLRSILPTLGASLVVGGAATGFAVGDTGDNWAAFFAGLGALALARALPWRFGERPARLALEPGAVDVVGAGALSQRIVATRVRAASTAQLGAGYAVALECPGRGRHPLVLKVESADEVERLCDALGVGYYGVGELRWPGDDAGARRGERGVALTATAACAYVAAALARPGPPGAFDPLFAPSALWVAVATLILVGLAIDRLWRDGAEHSVSLTKRGLDLRSLYPTFALLPYHLIESVAEAAGGVDVTLTPPYGALHVPLTAARSGPDPDVEAFAAQLRTAARRARGDRAPEPAIGASVEALRRQGESLEGWLARLDATARAMRGGSVYRGAALGARELREALDNHDADPELRAAAARVLVRVDPGATRPRVDAALATMRDAAARQKLRLVADVDAAAAEALAALEALEARGAGRAE